MCPSRVRLRSRSSVLLARILPNCWPLLLPLMSRRSLGFAIGCAGEFRTLTQVRSRHRRCAFEGLSARRFAEYLTLGQVPDAAAGGVPPAAAARGNRWVEPDSEVVTQEPDVERAGSEPREDASEKAMEAPVRNGQLRAPRRWEQLLLDAAVIGSRGRWRRRLEGLGNELRRRLAELADEQEAEAAALA